MQSQVRLQTFHRLSRTDHPRLYLVESSVCYRASMAAVYPPCLARQVVVVDARQSVSDSVRYRPSVSTVRQAAPSRQRLE